MTRNELLKKDDFDSTLSNNPIREETIDFEAWANWISYYRYYLDEFVEDVLGIKLFLFQRVILRAMARGQFEMLIACRGIGKSFICAVFFISMSILYSEIHCGIASGSSQQARNVIIQKIKGELSKYEAVAREINFPIKTSSEDCVCDFKGGSDIRAITLAQDRGGDSARSWRFHLLLIDEARLVKEDIIEEILIPMTKTKRKVAINWGKNEKGKVIFISSAYLKTSGLYTRFKYHCEQMFSGNSNYLAMCFPYQVGVQAGLFEQEDIEQERNKPTMSAEKFSYEYEGIFVGSSGESYYPYELTMPCRTLENCELMQPKKSDSIYVITHDVAVSGQRNSDNACTHVIKLKLRPNGTYTKSVVYTKVVNGLPLEKQRDFLRELIHLKFPNCKKLVIDERGAGNGLPRMFYESWEYTDPKSKVTVEYPPLIKDNDDEGWMLENAVPMIRAINATNEFHTQYYPYMKSCFEDRSLQILTQSTEKDLEYKSGELPPEMYAQFLEHDILQSELSNIKQAFSEHGNLQYVRITKTKKRDRATSLLYALSVISEWELENRQNLYSSKSDGYDLLSEYTFL